MAENQAYIDELVRESQNGNNKAFGEIYDTYFPKIYKYVFYKVSEEHVDDLVGTIFIKSWTQIKSYKKKTHPFSSWLFRIAHNTVIDHYRTYKEYYELEERIADENDLLNPQQLTEKTLNGERVHRALRKLDKNYREVILLKFMNDLNNREIAKTLGTNESNVRTIQFRALKKLRAIIEEQESIAKEKLKEGSKDNQKAGILKRIFVRSS